MTMELTIPEDLAEQLAARAASSGQDPADLAVSAIREKLRGLKSLDEVLAPIQQTFQDSGLSEDDALELFESEKHAFRRERSGADK